MNLTLSRFWSDEGGAELVEWAVMTIILLMATAALLIKLRVAVLQLFQRIFDAVQVAPPDQY